MSGFMFDINGELHEWAVDILDAVANSAPAFEDERCNYVETQVERDDWVAARTAHDKEQDRLRADYAAANAKVRREEQQRIDDHKAKVEALRTESERRTAYEIERIRAMQSVAHGMPDSVLVQYPPTDDVSYSWFGFMLGVLASAAVVGLLKIGGVM